MRINKSLLFILLFLSFSLGLFIPIFFPDFYPSLSLNNRTNTDSLSCVDSSKINLYLCPQDNCHEKLISFYNSANKSIHVMIYSFTKKDIADALIAAKKRGVDVKVIFDSTQASLEDAKDEYLKENGIDIKIVDLSGRNIFHNKISIIDGIAFSSGSYNYTNNASYGNAENLIFVYDKNLAALLEKEFEKYWEK
ncbi:MAG: phospholipase D-like domain-containing protein [Candidatus Diapherotrites archaeon]|nr:phospholipase D-like domain-containing protein [Candidatus Diapherotrites archaeon]